MKKVVLTGILAALMLCVCLSSCKKDDGMPTSFEIFGNKIECGMEMDKILDNLSGHEYEYSESISCAYDGLDKVYDFEDDGFILYTYPDSGKDYLLEVAVSSEKISQMSGKLYNGLTAEEATALLGNDYSEDGDTLSFKLDEKLSLVLLLTDGKVTEYSLSAAE